MSGNEQVDDLGGLAFRTGERTSRRWATDDTAVAFHPGNVATGFAPAAPARLCPQAVAGAVPQTWSVVVVDEQTASEHADLVDGAGGAFGNDPLVAAVVKIADRADAVTGSHTVSSSSLSDITIPGRQ